MTIPSDARKEKQPISSILLHLILQLLPNQQPEGMQFVSMLSHNLQLPI